MDAIGFASVYSKKNKKIKQQPYKYALKENCHTRVTHAPRSHKVNKTDKLIETARNQTIDSFLFEMP